MTVSKRAIAIKIFQMFETASDERAKENFAKYDEDPRQLAAEFRFLVKRSYAAAVLAMSECAKVCDECHEQDENDNGAAATFAAGRAAETIRQLVKANERS